MTIILNAEWVCDVVGLWYGFRLILEEVVTEDSIGYGRIVQAEKLLSAHERSESYPLLWRGEVGAMSCDE
jgi:hypothetical protein